MTKPVRPRRQPIATSPDELTPFVREALAQDVSRDRIASVLREAGWPQEKVEQALGGFAEVDFPIPVPRPRPYLSAREAFLYLLLFTTLFLWAFNLGSILFELIETRFPDPAISWDSGESLSWSVSYVVVSFPIFLFLTVYLNRELRRDPAKGGSKIRKWLTYLTLFVAAGFLLGDLVALIFHLLQGELTVRFLLKVAVVAALAGGIFRYYLADLKKEEE